jgi:predicted RNase H-like HicB family nuclease
MKEYTAVVEREPDGRYSVHVPDLPGCASMGDTRRQALTNVREAIACYEEGVEIFGASRLFEKPDEPAIELRDILPRVG